MIEYTKDEADIRATLNALDPVSTGVQVNDGRTVDEFSAWRKHAMWCPDTLAYITLGAHGVYREHTDDKLIADMKLFCTVRLAWAEERYVDLRGTPDKEMLSAARTYRKYADSACSAGRITGAARLWKSCHAISADALNRDPYALGTPAGVVDMVEAATYADLNTAARSELDLRDPVAALVTRSTRAELDGYATGSDIVPDPRWEEFVLEVMSGDVERAAYLKRALGYSCIGANPEECMFIAYGPTTRNGKGTLLNSVSHALGTYAQAATPTFLLTSTVSRGSTDEALASLAGARIVTLSEPPEGRRLDEAKVKGLTGNDPQSTSKKYGHQFTFLPSFTMWLACNRLPQVEDTSVFTSGRIRVIPFERHFSEAEQDRTLKDRFKTRNGMAAILRWLLEGYQDYLKRGLAEPASVTDATRAYGASGGSSLRSFIDSCCEIGHDKRMAATDLRDAYVAWCEDKDEPVVTSQAMRRELKTLTVEKYKSDGRWWYTRVSLNGDGELWLDLAQETLDAVTKEGQNSDNAAKNFVTDSAKLSRPGRIKLS